MRRVIVLCVLLAISLVAWLLYSGRIVVPAKWNPWAILSIADPPNLLTRFKLARLNDDPTTCLDVLSDSGFRFQPLPDREVEPGCHFRNAVLIQATNVRLGEAISLTCPAAISLALWETHTLQPAAKRFYAQDVVAIRHFGSYACRNIYGRSQARRSQHATANAFDIAGFDLADGRRITIVKGWNESDGEFLRAVRDGACRFFDAVLSPDYNAAHHDHLHLDRGPYRACR